MMFWINPRRDHQRWVQQTDQARQWLSTDAASLSEIVPRVSGWSPAQHLHHVADVNQRVLEQLMAVDAGGAPDAAGRPNVAGYLVLLMGRLPRGRGQSPKAFRPPNPVDPEALEQRVRANRAHLDALADRLGALRRSTDRFPHPVLGALSAGQWIRFAQIHTAHHHRIIRDILAEQR